MKNIMLDLETLGNSYNSVIVVVDAVRCKDCDYENRGKFIEFLGE